MTDDRPYEYQSISRPVEGLYKDKGSKFLAYLHPVKTIADIEQVMSDIASLHPKASHLCYAYRLGIEGDPFRINDDGEPSGSAGRPIYNELLSRQVSDVFCGVIRYFGGTKLGVPGLIKAYKQATIDAFDESQVITITLTEDVHVYYQIEDMGKVYELLKSQGYSEIESIFDPKPKCVIQVKLNELSSIKRSILAKYHGYQFEDIDDEFESERITVEVPALDK